jgi:hypothetical protein
VQSAPVPYVVGAFSTIMRLARKCRSECCSEYRIADLEEARSRTSVLVRMRPRGSGVALYAPVASVSKNQVVKSHAKGISIRSVSAEFKGCFISSDENLDCRHQSLLLRLTYRDHIITLSLDPMISGFERIFDPAAIFPYARLALVNLCMPASLQ